MFRLHHLCAINQLVNPVASASCHIAAMKSRLVKNTEQKPELNSNASYSQERAAEKV